MTWLAPRPPRVLSLVIVSTLLAVGLAGCTEAPLAATPASAPDLIDLKDATNRKDCPPGELHEYDMYVQQSTTWSPYEGRELTGLTFGLAPDGPFSVPAPTLRVTQCDTLRVRLHTEPGQLSHTIHWHGLSLPWAMDGVAYVTQDVGPGVFTYEFQVTESGTYWYHCHVEAPVHMDMGMFGALIVDPLDPAVDRAYDREAILMLSEVDSAYNDLFQATFGGGPQSAPETSGNPNDRAEDIVRSTRMVGDVGGFIVEGVTGVDGPSEGPRPYYPEESLRYRPQYDTFMINGKSYPDTEPVLTATGETVRLRIISAATMVHTLHLHGHHFLVTHKDGYPLLSPYYADTLVVGPAERYDLYVESDNPGIWDFHDHGGGWGYGGHAANDFAFPGGMNTMFVYEDFQYAELEGPRAGGTSGDYAVFSPGYRGAHHPHNGPS